MAACAALALVLAGCDDRPNPLGFDEVGLGSACDQPAIAPTTISLGCSDQRIELDRVEWKNWAKPTATGTGLLRACREGCTPNGSGLSYHVTVTAKHLKRCTSDSLVYTELRYRVVDFSGPGRRPADGVRHSTCSE